MSGTGWSAAAPILRVRDLDASLQYYMKVLGFKLDWRAGMIASVTRDRCCLFLCTGDQSAPRMWVWLGAPDVRALHEDLKARGAVIRHPPTNFEWALEMQVADPDGNVLRIGCEPDGDASHGEWLDANGRVWRRFAGGEWTQDPA